MTCSLHLIITRELRNEENRAMALMGLVIVIDNNTLRMFAAIAIFGSVYYTTHAICT